MTNQNDSPILRDFEVIRRFSITHQKEMPYLHGKVYNDKRFPNGSSIRTSAVLEMTEDYAQTANTKYKLEGRN